MAIKAQLHDGTILQFPDNTPDSVIQQTVKRHLGLTPELAPVPNVQGDTQVPPQEGSSVSVALPHFSGTGTPEAPPLNAIQDPTFHEALGRAFAKRILDNGGQIPGQILAHSIPRGEAVTNLDMPSLFGPITGNAMELASKLAGKILGEDIPARARQGTNDINSMLTGENAFAALRVPGEAAKFVTGQPAQNYEQLQGTEAAITRKYQNEAPLATALGGVFGDIATIAAGRKAVRANDPIVQEALGKALPAFTDRANTVVLRALQAVGRAAKRTGFRATRTATEAAFLASLQGQDMSKAGAAAGGAQVLSDAGAALFRGMRHKGLLASVGTLTLIKLGIDQFTPGGLDRILPNIEAANKEVILATLIGGAGGLVLGHVPDSFNGPAFAALSNVIKRGAVISALNSYVRDPIRVGPIIKKFSEDPAYFGEKAQRLLERAVNSESIDIRTTIDSLMKDKAFKKKFDALKNEAFNSQ